jgi:phosphomethylpyrimidine synthase
MDNKMADARKNLDWDKQESLCIDPINFKNKRKDRSSSSSACSMCGELCVYKILENQ